MLLLNFMRKRIYSRLNSIKAPLSDALQSLKCPYSTAEKKKHKDSLHKSCLTPRAFKIQITATMLIEAQMHPQGLLIAENVKHAV